MTRKIADSEPVSAFVFKTTADPFAGRITFFKVYSGVLKNDANLHNVQRGTAERLSHICLRSGEDLNAGYGSARGRYRRRGQAEGHA